MDAHACFNEIRHAVEPVLELIWSDYQNLQELREEHRKLNREAEEGYRRAIPPAGPPDPDFDSPDEIMMRTGQYWDTYFGADKDANDAAQRIERLGTSIQIKEFSSQALSGSVLHFAKQGMSIVSGGLATSGGGRQIGSLKLRDVIWQGRNQSIHWEEGNFRQPVIDCFDTLKRERGSKFSNYESKNKAFEVLSLIEWTDWSAYKLSMNSILV